MRNAWPTSAGTIWVSRLATPVSWEVASLMLAEGLEPRSEAGVKLRE